MQKKLQLPDYYQNTSVLHVGCEENRSYYLPAAANEADSDSRVVSLNGDWDFRPFENPFSIDDFTAEGYSFSDYDTIPVPGCVQMYGYDQHQYTNVQYPFPYDPPYIPVQNKAYVYHRTLTLTDAQLALESYLNFEGVDSCFYVYLNSELIGYSQVSHSTSEFDLTGKLHTGCNDLCVVVLKWCDGSYLEDQDKFRMTGIFRDVYLLLRPQAHVRDYFVHTKLSDDFKHAEVSIELFRNQEEASFPVTALLFDAQGNQLAVCTSTDTAVSFQIDDPTLWNAEQPYLYTVKLCTEDEILTQQIGLRKLEIRDKVLYLNGHSIKFKGVNRHDSDPETGFTISREQAIIDLKLMKEANMNAIRTSHYPNAPWFPALCDQYGFYMIAEADIESHGSVCQIGKHVWGENSFNETFADVTRREIFAEAILDRNQRNVIRDKNHPSILLWSLGNESGYSRYLEAAATWIHAYDPDRFVHYEGGSAHLPDSFSDSDPKALDVHSEMYTSVEELEKKLPDLDKPYMLCEFIHAMGNGPGGIEEYIQSIYNNDSFIGGFVWEWCDHGIYRGVSHDGIKMFAYGGDSGEFPHDGNFCMDGLVSPDRIPHPGYQEYKNAIRPVRASVIDAKSFTVKLENKLDFTNTKDFLYLTYELLQNGVLLESHKLDEISIEPHESCELSLKFNCDASVLDRENVTVILRYVQKQDAGFTSAEHALGFDELWLTEETTSSHTDVSERDTNLKAAAVSESDTDLKIAELSTELILTGADFCYHFDKLTGCFSSLVTKNEARMTRPMEYNIFRAPTDNDRNIRHQWEQAGYDRSSVRVYSTEVTADSKSVRIGCHCAMQALCIQNCLTFTAVWTIASDGTIDVTLDVTRNTDFPYLPRFGLRLYLPKEYQKLAYTGYGPLESYIDKHCASWFGQFDSTVDGEYVNTIKPQEHGSHYHCHEMSILSDRESGLQVTSRQPFSFQAGRYAQEELTAKRHNYELVKSDDTILCLDVQMSGIGTNSCGPTLPEKYQLCEEKFSGNFQIGILS